MAQAQSVSSVESVDTFTWDWAVPVVPALLQAGDTRYLVGHDTLGHLADSVWRYYLPDHLGSVRQSVDAAGTLVAAREWSPYGVEPALSGAEGIGAAQDGLGFTGEWFDAAVGLQYLRARWYQPGTGRFTQPDAIINTPVYHYASGNPVNRIDPSGHIDWSACVINGAYGACVIEQDDTLYKIARQLQGAGIESQAGLAKVVADIIGYNPALRGNPNYIRIGDLLTLPAEWINALQIPPGASPIDAVVIIIEPVAPRLPLPPGVLKTSCLPGCAADTIPAPAPQWRDYVSTAGEFMGHPAIDHLDAILGTFEHGIPGLSDGLIPHGELGGAVFQLIAQLAQDANVDTCLGNRVARGVVVAGEQVVVGVVSGAVGKLAGMGGGMLAGTISGGNLVAFGVGYIGGWGLGYGGSYIFMTLAFNHANEQLLFPWLEDLLCE